MYLISTYFTYKSTIQDPSRALSIILEFSLNAVQVYLNCTIPYSLLSLSSTMADNLYINIKFHALTYHSTIVGTIEFFQYDVINKHGAT